jgi:hypothetical protein
MKTNQLKITYQKTGDLVPYARNSRTHSEEQVGQIAASIREFGFTNPVLVDEGNTIIAGHGRIMAAQKLGLGEVPTITLAGLTESQRKAYIIADNRLALNAGWDDEMLRLEIADLKEADFDLDLLGFEDDEIAALEIPSDGTSEAENPYTAKVEAPIYEITGAKPQLAELYDKEKYLQLTKKIDQSSVPNDIKDFLILAASRHIIFDYQHIAEFYAHADKQTQLLMEDLALIIIDFKKAIEMGYVKLTERVAGQFAQDFDNE